MSAALDLGSIDADGIMIKAAAIIGRHHAQLGLKPNMQWFTQARQTAYLNAHREASRS